MKKTVIIVAGGKGTRMKGKTPKQFIEIHDKPLLMHSFECFHRYDDSILFILALHPDYFSMWKDLINKNNFSIKHDIVKGGDTRFHSVLNALDKSCDECLIAVHDAVRPLVSSETIERCFNVAEQKGNAVPCIEISESVRELTADGSRPVHRDRLRMIQTPQVFRADILKQAYRQTYIRTFSDDASVVEYAGYTITLVQGNRENIKITTREDLLIARALIK
jgi:2-C-methyl-D-erythritol 4-phosphate cytidylyltransferase